ncbi:MAG: triose-phosphate isomerase [Candidatus Promineifilaceae bacterium]
MRKPILAANWKMNKTADEAVAFVRQIRHPLHELEGLDCVICPPFVALPAVADALAATRVAVGAQNMYFEANGAYTGEVSAPMLLPYCRYVILGHSERRAYFGESDEVVNKKVLAALAHQLTPIVCVGESLQQNEAGQTHEFVGRQVRAAFAGVSAEQAAGCVVAYEPIWAIGAGRSASPADAGRIIGLTVRGALADLYGEQVAQAARVQYGGSATADNLGDFMAQPDVDGALVGGASLKPEFVQMARIAAKNGRL